MSIHLSCNITTKKITRESASGLGIRLYSMSSLCRYRSRIMVSLQGSLALTCASVRDNLLPTPWIAYTGVSAQHAVHIYQNPC